jgi:hypothetical protein
MIKSGHVAQMGEKRNLHKLLWESEEERDHWKYQDVSKWTILK